MAFAPRLVLFLTLFAGAAAAQEQSEAPDGRPGLGTVRGAHELGRVFTSPSAREEELLQALEETRSDIRVLREMVRRAYRARGYFDLVRDSSEADLDALHARFAESEPIGLDLIVGGGDVADAYAAMLVDLRFQARLPLLATFEREDREITMGLALLRASQDGYVELKDNEARAVAGRIDLAAALMRSIRLDLDVLRERGDAQAPGEPDPNWIVELIGIAHTRPEKARREAYVSFQRKIDRHRERLETVLFWPRLTRSISTQLDRRVAVADASAAHLDKVQRYLLVPPHDDDPAPEVAALDGDDRHRYALSEGLRGLSVDPLNEDLTYWTAVAAAYLYAPHEARQWFDRYLALRGIRSHKEATLRGRELNSKEKLALERVRQAFQVPGTLGR